MGQPGRPSVPRSELAPPDSSAPEVAPPVPSFCEFSLLCEFSLFCESSLERVASAGCDVAGAAVVIDALEELPRPTGASPAASPPQPARSTAATAEDTS